MLLDKNKKKWRKVKFSDIAESIGVRIDPAKAETEVYVGLEHLDPESLHLRRWGHPSDVTGQKLVFQKGDVIFGRRRAYQRKLAVAEFDGICSAHAMVLRAKTEVILPEFLPFFIQSDVFMQRAIDISVGSLSPTVNWNTLRVQEFYLPPIEEQKRIAEVLWAADAAYEHNHKSYAVLMQLKQRILNEYTAKGLSQSSLQQTRIGKIPVHWELLTIDEVVVKCQYGLSIPLHESGTYPILRMMNYDDGKIVANELKYVDLPDVDFESFKLAKGDILFNRTNSADLVGKVGVFDLDGDFVFASYLVRLQADESKVVSSYLNYYLNSSLGQSRILAYATPGVSQTNISAGNLKKVVIPVPPIDEQEKIVEKIDAIEIRKYELRKHITCAKETLDSLINSLLAIEK